MRSEQEVNRAIEQYSDMVRRLCLIHLKNDADTEDIFQTVFLKYALSSAAFESDEHEKAWLIRVTINACKDLLKSLFHRRTVPLDEILEQPAEMREDHKEVLEAVLSLPQKYREVVYLHYYEGYTAPEIGKNPIPEASESVENRMDLLPVVKPGNLFSRSRRILLTASEPSMSMTVFDGMVIYLRFSPSRRRSRIACSAVWRVQTIAERPAGWSISAACRWQRASHPCGNAGCIHRGL